MAPSYPEPATSGTYVEIGASGSSTPRPTRIPATQLTTDLVTDISRWGVVGVIGSTYRSSTSTPS